MTPAQAQALKVAIRKLVLAEIANSWKGGGHPEDIPIIEEDLRNARIRVTALLNKHIVFPKGD